MSQKHIDANCGRGQSWAVKQQPVGSNNERYKEEQAWYVEAGEAFSGDLSGMISANLKCVSGVDHGEI